VPPTAAATGRKGPRLWMLLVAGWLAATAVFALARLNQPELLDAAVPAHAAPTLAGSLDIEPAKPTVGQQVTVRVSISSDRPITVRTLIVKVRSQAGPSYDFPSVHDYPLGTTPQEIVLQRTFDQPGVYSYYLAYDLDGTEIPLPPWQTFTVR
jgi:hypothetical protein